MLQLLSIRQITSVNYDCNETLHYFRIDGCQVLKTALSQTGTPFASICSQQAAIDATQKERRSGGERSMTVRPRRPEFPGYLCLTH